LQRIEVLRDLEVLRRQEHGTAQASVDAETDRVRDVEPGIPEDREGQHRVQRRALPGREAGDQCQAAGDRAKHVD
jgi:hypothetical protein